MNGQRPYDAYPDTLHESHDTRVSMGASSFDEICKICGRTDISGGGWGWLRMPCPGKKRKDIASTI